jgi:hypothetical protein
MGEGKGVKSTETVTVAISNVRAHNNWFAVAKLEEVGGWLEQRLRHKQLRQGWAWHRLRGVFRDHDVRV